MEKEHNSLKLAIGIPLFCLGISMWIIDPSNLIHGFWQSFNYILTAILITAIGLELLS